MGEETWVAEGSLDREVADLARRRGSTERVQHGHLDPQAVGGLDEHAAQLPAAQTAHCAGVHGRGWLCCWKQQ